MRRVDPQVVFVKGGFVGVPVGLAATFWKIPYVTHDSDAIAGLANRIIARWAHTHAVALPVEQYVYPIDKTVTVGVPIASEYQKVTPELQISYKKQLGLTKDEKVLLVTGGGLGARLINTSVTVVARRLLQQHPDLHIFHTTGHVHFESVKQLYEGALSSELMQRVHLIDYTSELYTYSGAADVIVARAGATNMAELATQSKATIIVPNPVLAGGHQLKNAEAYTKARAVTVVHEADLKNSPEGIFEAVHKVLSDASLREVMAANFHQFAHEHSAEELSQLLLLAAEQGDSKVGM